MPSNQFISCDTTYAAQITAIINYEIANSSSIYDLHPRTLAHTQTWMQQRLESGLPILGIVDEDDKLLAYGTYGMFRPFEAYRSTVEHSIYVHHQYRGVGYGRMMLNELIDRARVDGRHSMIAGIDAQNVASIRLHEELGFQQRGNLPQVAMKFGRWLDLLFYQLILPS